MNNLVTLLASLFLLSGCTTLMAPGDDLIEHTRVLDLGSTMAEQTGDYILRIPAGQNVPIHVLLDGSLFQDAENIEAKVRLNNDLYLYKYWASHDGVDWQKWGDMVSVEVSSGMDTEGAQLNAIINETGGKKR